MAKGKMISEYGGKEKYTSKKQEVKHEKAEGKKVGMVTDDVWVDLDNDTWEDLVIVGELREDGEEGCVS